MDYVRNAINYAKSKFGQVTWTPRRIPDLSGRVCIVTGGDSGIGYEVVKRLAEHHAYVIMAGRNEQKCRAAISNIRSTDGISNGQIEFMPLDLSSLKSVQQFADMFHSRGVPLHLLINNAGFGVPEGQERTDEDLEIHIGTLFFGHLLLTHLLLDILKASAPSRIIFMSSAEEARGFVPWDDLSGMQAKELGTNFDWYGAANLCKLMVAREMSRRMKTSTVLSPVPDIFAVQPGIASTGFFSKMDYSKPETTLHNKAQQMGGQSPETGAISTLYAATEPNLQDFQYIGPWYFWFPAWWTVTKKFPMALNVFQTASLQPSSPEGKDMAACSRLYEQACDVLERKLGRPVPHRLTSPYTTA